MANNCFDCKFMKSAFSDLSKINNYMRKVEDGFYVQCLVGHKSVY